MKSIFEDPGNQRALGMIKEKVIHKIQIDEPGILTLHSEEMYYQVRSALIRNQMKFTELTT